MDATERRTKITEKLTHATSPISASVLAEQFSVSRQVIVSDVAIIRAAGTNIMATPRGYVLENEKNKHSFFYEGILVCKHTPEQLRDELYTIVDYGGYVIDVTVEHSLYGQLAGSLNIGSRYEVDLFIEKVSGETDRPLSILTDGIHLHTIGCSDKETFDLIKESLIKQNIVMDK